LKHQGESLGRKRVVRLLNELQIHSVTKRKFKATTNSKHNKPAANNLLNRDFNPIQPNDTWVADITYIRTRDGWLYLSVVIELFSRKVVSWSTSERMTAPLVIDSLEKAIKERRPKIGLLFHSDQGVQ
jgi:transposase InsO family protein